MEGRDVDANFNRSQSILSYPVCSLRCDCGILRVLGLGMFVLYLGEVCVESWSREFGVSNEYLEAVRYCMLNLYVLVYMYVRLCGGCIGGAKWHVVFDSYCEIGFDGSVGVQGDSMLAQVWTEKISVQS